MTRYVIHNHLPACKTRDAKFYFRLKNDDWGYVDATSPEHAKTKVKAERGEVPVHVEKVAAKDAKNLAYDIKVRRMTSGADFNIRLFAASQEDAERRAKERARQMEKIPSDKYKEYERAGHAVFRIVSSKVSENQQPYQGDAADGDKWQVEFDKGGKINIPSEADQHVEAVAKRLKLWDGKGEFPSFTIYKNGKEIGGG